MQTSVPGVYPAPTAAPAASSAVVGTGTPLVHLCATLRDDQAPDSGSVLGKVQMIIEAFGPDEVHLSLAEIARRTGLAKASVPRSACCSSVS